MVEIILKKVSPALYQALGVFLPLITTNCCILGVAILVIPVSYTHLSVSTFADGIAVKEPGTNTFDWVNQYVDGVVTVTEDEIAAAILALIERQRIVAEQLLSPRQVQKEPHKYVLIYCILQKTSWNSPKESLLDREES